MSHLVVAKNPSEAYLELRDKLLTEGRCVSPRGQKTLELPAVTTVLTDPTRPAPVGVGRGLVPRIGVCEGVHLTGGHSDADQLVNCAKNFEMFVEGPSGHRLMGAYGPRAHGQWQRVIQQLADDNDTRQAGLNLWRKDELAVPSKDVPCTLSLYYQIRDNKLEAFTTMRSNDLVWGTPYDWMQFTYAQRALADSLGVGLGPYTHHTYSLHAYVDRDDISTWALGHDREHIQPPPFDTSTTRKRPYSAAVALERWKWIESVSDYLVGIGDKPAYWTTATQWMDAVLKDTQSGGRRCWGCRYVLPDNGCHFPTVWDSSGAVGLCKPCVTEF